MTGALIARGVSVARDGRVVLAGVDLVLRQGEVVALMGHSGAGKSTLLAVLAGLDPADGGSVAWNGLRPALVLQRAEVALSAETVAQELGLAADLAGAAPIDPGSARGALAAVGLDGGYLRRDPLALSGGEQRRVAIAAAIATRPAVLLLDEPTAGLDGAARDALHGAVRQLAAAGVAVVLATHDPDEVFSLCGRVVGLGGGRVVADGPVAAVLGSVAAARRAGLAPPTVVRVAHALSRPGSAHPVTSDEDELLDWIATRAATGAGTGAGDIVTDVTDTTQDVTDTGSLVPPLHAGGHRGDMRLRLVAWVLLVVAAFAARSMVGVAAAGTVGVAMALLAGARVRDVGAALRPFLLLVATLVLVQLLLGARPPVALWRGHVVHSGAWFAVRRTLQVVAIVTGSLALTARSSPLDLTRALAWLFAPLRALRIPVDDVSFVAGVGLASAGSLTAELDRIERAWRARGIDPARLPLTRRLRARALLVVPFLVVVFRRSHTLADALHSRGFASGRPRSTWLHPRATAADRALLVVGIAAVIVAVLA